MLENGKISSSRAYMGLFWVLAVLATIYFFITVLPLFNTYFIADDIFTLDDSPPVREHPFSFLSVTFMDMWWRPLMFGITSYFYLLVGLNPVAFHWFGLILHLGGSFSLFFFIKRLFNVRSALIAYILYMISPVMVGSVGFVTDMIEDELAAIFVFLALGFAIPKAARKVMKRPYYFSSIFMVCAALCKESALGIMPAIFYLDWINYPVDAFGKRIQRLLPYGSLMLIFPLRLMFVGFNVLYSSSTTVFGSNFSFLNILWTMILAFFPIMLQSSQQILNWFLALVPLSFVIVAFILSDGRRNKMLFLTIALAGALSVLSSIALYHAYGAGNVWLYQWIRMPTLVGIAACIIALICEEVMNRAKRAVVAVSFVSLFLIGFYGVPAHFMIEAESDELRQLSDINIAKHKKLIDLINSFPPESKVYLLQKKLFPMNIINDAVRKKGTEVIILVRAYPHMSLLHNPDPINKYTKLIFPDETSSYIQKHYKLKPGTYYIMTDEQLFNFVKSLARDPKVRIVNNDENLVWQDVTERFKE